MFQIKWKGGTTGQVIGSIGQDLKLKVWQEDIRHARNTGRLFKNVFSVSSGNLVIYASLDFKVMDNDTVMAAVTRDGLLTLYEPVKAEAFDDWKDVDQFWVDGEPIPRGTETSFKVSFQQHNGPTITAIACGLAYNTMSCAVACMEVVRLFRVVREDMVYQFQPHFAELRGGQGLIRDLTWCPIAWLDYDLVATSKGDGYVRFYSVYSWVSNKQEDPKSPQATSFGKTAAKRSTASGITAGLTGASLGPGPRNSRESEQVKHEVILDEEVKHDGVWPIRWIPNCTYCHRADQVKLTMLVAKTLVTAGGQANLKIWKRSIDGRWREFAESELEE